MAPMLSTLEAAHKMPEAFWPFAALCELRPGSLCTKPQRFKRPLIGASPVGGSAEPAGAWPTRPLPAGPLGA